MHLSNDTHSWIGTLVDVSNSGIHCSTYGSTNQEPTAGEEFECTFVLPTGSVKSTVKVIWTKNDGGSIGVEFVEISKQHRVALDTYCSNPFY